MIQFCVCVCVSHFLFHVLSHYGLLWASLVAQMVKNLPAVWETWVWSLDWEDSLEEGMATHSSILAWRIHQDKEAWKTTIHGVAKSWTWVFTIIIVYFIVKVYVIYNYNSWFTVVLVSGIAEWFSFMCVCMCIHTFFFIFFSVMIYYRTPNIVSVLYSRTLCICFIYSSLYLLIPNS